jgi:hypothetical protein
MQTETTWTIRELNPVIEHHEAHIRSALGHQQAVALEQAATLERFRECRAEAVAYRVINAQRLYWLHAQCLCEILRGDYC